MSLFRNANNRDPIQYPQLASKSSSHNHYMNGLRQHIESLNDTDKLVVIGLEILEELKSVNDWIQQIETNQSN